MLDQRTRSLTILARLQAGLGAAVVVIIFAVFALAPNTLTDTTLSLAAVILGAAAAVYFLSLHQVLKKTKLALSTLFLSIITLINLVLVIASTGGLDSPFYSLWLLAIVAAGIFGMIETIVIVSLTSTYYLVVLFTASATTPNQTDHLIQFLITLAAAGLAEWIFSRGRKAGANSSKLVSLSGQLTTEQLKAEAIMASIGEGVMVIDSARRIQLFNKAAQDLTGWDESSAQNIDYNLVLQLKTSDDQPVNQFNDPFDESWKKGTEIVRKNLVAVTRGGRKVQLNISVSPIFNDKKQPTGAIALFRDISQEKEVERQKDEFVSTASHEMRTPVAAIEGYISLAMNPNVASIDDRAKKYLEKAHDTIGHLGELFRDLLNVTKAEEGQLGGKIEAINIGKLTQSSVDDMQFTAQKHNLTLVYQIGNQSGKAIAPLYYVAANPERLREVIMNLIDNAIKFTSEGGVKVILEGDDKEVKVSVNDSGVGIAPEDIGHLFQKFYRIDNSATRTIGGTGLGLYLCRRLIESFNGRIWAEGKAGEGSTFRFSLPRLTQTEIDRLDQQANATAVTPTAGAIVNPGQSPTAPSMPAAIPVVAPAPAPVMASTTPAPASTPVASPAATTGAPAASAAPALVNVPTTTATQTIVAAVAAAAAPQSGSAGPAVAPAPIAMPVPAAAGRPEDFDIRNRIQ